MALQLATMELSSPHPSSAGPRLHSSLRPRPPIPVRFVFSSSLSHLRLRFSSEPRRRTAPLVASGAGALAPEQAEIEPLPADVRVTETKLPRSSVLLHVEVPPIISQDCYKRVLNEFAKRIKFPGFRPGKRVPEDLLVNYAGKEQLQQATIESILKRTLPNATSLVKGRALKDSIRIETKFADMNEKFSLQDIFRYDVVADVAPEVKWLSEDGYRNMKITVEIDKDVMAERACDVELKHRHKALGSLRIVSDRCLQLGDLVVLDIFATTVNDDESEGEKIPSAESKGFHLDTGDAYNLLPGFLDSIVGIQQGETRSFLLRFPDTWEQKDLRGIQAKFTVKCKELFYRELPELNDSLADKLVPGCETMKQVYESIFERCKTMEAVAIEQATDNAILDQLSQIVEVDVPQSLFEEQGRQLYGAKLLELQASKKIEQTQLAILSSTKAVNEYLQNERENVTKIIKQMLAVGEIFKCENLEYSTEELVKEVENSIAEFKRHNQEYEEEQIKEQVRDVLEGAKVLEWLRENADIRYTEI